MRPDTDRIRRQDTARVREAIEGGHWDETRRYIVFATAALDAADAYIDEASGALTR